MKKISISNTEAKTQNIKEENDFFALEANNTDVKTEVLAGLTTFMTMAYVIIVHPSIMSAAGMPVGAMTVVTALVTGIFTLFMGLYTNLPYALAPAMGSNAFMAYTLVASGLTTWQQALAMVFISGITFIILTVLGFREVIVEMVPTSIKTSIGAAIGLFIAQLGFSSAGFMDFQNGLLTAGNIKTPGAILAIIGFFLIASLMALKVKGALFWGIIATTIIGIPMGITQIPDTFISMPPSIAPIAFKLDISGALKFSFIPLMFVFFSGDFFSTMGTLLGVSAKAGFLDEDGNLPNIEKPFLVDGIATTVGALMGTSTVTTYVESAAGVEEGGRTGLTAVVTAAAFFLMIFLTPLAAIIPGQATAPALILIGLMMMPAIKEIDFDDITESLPAFVTVIFTAYTFNLANGISLGIISYVLIKLVSGRKDEIPVGLYFLCIPLFYYFYTL
ncbi:MAG: NCS2 family permease [Bacillota bacterium]